MKKVLSILLIAAAAFGFYGGAVSINDVLDSKAYWEEEGKKTTKDLNTLEDGLDKLKANTAAYKDGLKTYNEGLITLANGEKEYAAGKADYAAAPGKLEAARKQIAEGEAELAKGKASIAKLEQAIKGCKDIPTAYSYSMGVSPDDGKTLLPSWTTAYSMISAADSEGITPRMTIYGGASNIKDSELFNIFDDEDKNSFSTNLTTLLENMSGEEAGKYAKFASAAEGVSGLLNKLPSEVSAVNDLKSGINTWLTGYDGVLKGKMTMAEGIDDIIGGIIDDKETLYPAAYQTFGGTALTVLETYRNLSGESFESFKEKMDVLIKLINGDTFGSLGAFYQKVLDMASAKVAAGEKDLAAGKQEYQKGLADYEAAPAKLAAAEVQLADGKAQLADGKKQLDQYRDGEKTLREGLATLMGTKADPGLKSIAARVGEKETFTGVDGFFNFDAGYKGLKAGRAYQDDSGVVITKELTSRAVGLGVGIGAGVVALLAAILGLLKKNKVAAVFGLIAAAAAGFGAYYVNAAGTFYSEGAGSTVGNLPMIAMCVLAGVAAIFAIANFAAPKAEVETKSEA